MKKFIAASLLAVAGVLSCFQASAQIDNCIVPGYPGCSTADFNRALQAQQAQFDYQQQLELQRRNNELLKEQNRILRDQQFQQQFQSNPVNIYNQLKGQRCLTAPLNTPGC